MQDWRVVHDGRTERPEELDTTSSMSTVYERRNIRQETWHDEMGDADITEWVYEQREYTQEEYAALNAPVTKTIMQAISEIELSIAMLGM